MDERVEVRSWKQISQPYRAIYLWIVIYGMSIACYWVLHLIFSRYAWSAAGFWDNVGVQLSALWFFFVFAAVGLWPFDKIKKAWKRGVSVISVTWIMGIITWFLFVKVVGSAAVPILAFPFIGCMFFLVTAFAYVGENTVFGKMSKGQIFFTLLILCFSLTWLVMNSFALWIPAYWFAFGQLFLVTQVLNTKTLKNTPHPYKDLFVWALLAALVAITLFVASLLGLWDMGATGVSEFWHLGGGTWEFFVFFAAWCSFTWGVLYPLGSWPVGRVGKGWDTVIGGIVTICISALVAFTLIKLFALWFPSDLYLGEAFALAYMATNWEFAITLGFDLP